MTTDALMDDASLSATVEAAKDEAQDLLAALVQHPTENPPGDLGDATEWLAETLEGRGLEVERHPVPKPFARGHKRTGIVNLIVGHTFGSGPTVCLHAPLDTLPAGKGWRREPFSGAVHNGLLHGRGARDSKADLVAYLFALEALKGQGAGLSGRVEIHITGDEESGGFLGPAFLIGHGLSAPDAVIAAGTSHQVVTGQQGVLHLEVVLRGRQAHASKPEDGADAILAAIPLLQAVADLSARERTPLTIGTVRGGRGVNLVADRARFTIDRRINAGEDGEAVEAALAEHIRAAHTMAGVELEVRRLLLAEPVVPSPESERLAETLARHAEAAIGRPVPVASAPVVSGARHYALAGIPTVLYGVGPPIVGEGADMGEDECVSLNDLACATLAVASTVAELLGPDSRLRAG
ncbi:MAG: M20/M25/M40 family metallo-hydrolase [Pseudomonadota bacterium]